MMGGMPLQPRPVEEAPPYGMNRIIGVEMTYRDSQGSTHELEMFACKHILPSARNGYNGGYGQEILITLHTTEGDKQGVIQLR